MDEETEKLSYRVLVDDNFHYMDEDERYAAGTYDNFADAVLACRRIVDQFLEGERQAGMTAATLYERYRGFGPDPFVRCNDPPYRFSAWTYAEARCRQLCAEG